MEPCYILAVDEGTSGTKATLFDHYGELAGRHTEPLAQFYPRPGWVEQDAAEIYQKTLRAIAGVLADTGAAPSSVAARAVSIQRETVVVWDRSCGEPVYPAVVWQCGRGIDICRALEKQGLADEVRQKTGLVLSPYFSAAKIAWILDLVPGARRKAERGLLACGTVDSWLIYRLTGGQVHATDFSNASRTQLFHIGRLRWDEDLLQAFRIPDSMMPEVRSSNGDFGDTTAGGAFPAAVPIAGVMGDSHAALFGQCCFEPGMAKVTYGTGSSIMMHIGRSPRLSDKGVVTSLAWGIDGRPEYVWEGNVNFTGATIQWLVEDLQLFRDARSVSRAASEVESSEGVYLVPAFTGLGAPYWDSEARAILCGMTRSTRRAHLARAAEESIAYQVRDVLETMTAQAGAPLRELRVDGGPSRDDLLMQFQADILSARVVPSRVEEISAAGVAFMAGLHIGLWKDRAELAGLHRHARVFTGRMDAVRREALYRGWKQAVARACFPRRIREKV